MLFLIFIWCLGCIGVLPTYVSLPGLCLVPVDARRGHQIPWNWGYKPLWAPWGLSSKSGSSGRANALIHRVTSHPPKKMIFFSLLEQAEKWAAIHAIGSGALNQSHDDYTLSLTPLLWKLMSAVTAGYMHTGEENGERAEPPTGISLNSIVILPEHNWVMWPGKTTMGRADVDYVSWA